MPSIEVSGCQRSFSSPQATVALSTLMLVIAGVALAILFTQSTPDQFSSYILGVGKPYTITLSTLFGATSLLVTTSVALKYFRKEGKPVADPEAIDPKDKVLRAPPAVITTKPDVPDPIPPQSQPEDGVTGISSKEAHLALAFKPPPAKQNFKLTWLGPPLNKEPVSKDFKLPTRLSTNNDHFIKYFLNTESYFNSPTSLSMISDGERELYLYLDRRLAARFHRAKQASELPLVVFNPPTPLLPEEPSFIVEVDENELPLSSPSPANRFKKAWGIQSTVTECTSFLMNLTGGPRLFFDSTINPWESQIFFFMSIPKATTTPPKVPQWLPLPPSSKIPVISILNPEKKEIHISHSKSSQGLEILPFEIPPLTTVELKQPHKATAPSLEKAATPVEDPLQIPPFKLFSLEEAVGILKNFQQQITSSIDILGTLLKKERSFLQKIKNTTDEKELKKIDTMQAALKSFCSSFFDNPPRFLNFCFSTSTPPFQIKRTEKLKTFEDAVQLFDEIYFSGFETFLEDLDSKYWELYYHRAFDDQKNLLHSINIPTITELESCKNYLLFETECINCIYTLDVLANRKGVFFDFNYPDLFYLMNIRLAKDLLRSCKQGIIQKNNKELNSAINTLDKAFTTYKNEKAPKPKTLARACLSFFYSVVELTPLTLNSTCFIPFKILRAHGLNLPLYDKKTILNNGYTIDQTIKFTYDFINEKFFISQLTPKNLKTSLDESLNEHLQELLKSLNVPTALLPKSPTSVLSNSIVQAAIKKLLSSEIEKFFLKIHNIKRQEIDIWSELISYALNFLTNCVLEDELSLGIFSKNIPNPIRESFVATIDKNRPKISADLKEIAFEPNITGLFQKTLALVGALNTQWLFVKK